jgi:hypothetical protein
MTDTKFCTSCQAMRSLEGGVVRQTRGVPRWICQLCLEKKSPSIYRNQSGTPANVAKIMAGLYARQR